MRAWLEGDWAVIDGAFFAEWSNARGWRRGARSAGGTSCARLIGQGGRPGIYVFSTCADTIRTLPALQHDAGRPEDVDSDGEDNAADEVRYACMSRPWLPRRVVPKRPDRLV